MKNLHNSPHHRSSHIFRHTTLSLGYWFSAYSLGLLLHPYQSVRRLVREDFYKPLVWLPLVCLFIWWLLGVIVGHFNILLTLGFDFLDLTLKRLGPTQIALSFLFMWVSMFFICWQVLLGYLYWRFRSMAKK